MVQMAIRSKIDSARSYWRAVLAGEGSLWSIASVAVVFALGFYVDRAVPMPMEARAAYWVGLGILLSGMLIFLVIRPLLRPRSPEAIAALVEQRYPELRERLLSAVEFSHLPEERLRGVSSALLTDLQQDADRAAAPLDFRKAFKLQGLARSSSAFGLALLFIGLHLVFAGPAFARYVERMMGSNLPVYRDTEVQVSPLRTKALKGGDLVITVDQNKKAVDRAQLFFRFGNGRWSRQELKGKPGEDFKFRIASLSEDISYYALAGDGRSDVGKVDAVDAATIIGATVKLEYPAYMGKPVATVNAPSGGVAAPVGTRVSLELKANKPLERAEATLPKAAPKNWTVNGDTVYGGLTVTGNGNYTLQLRDTDGFNTPEPQNFPIKAIPDQAPEVSLLDPAADLDVVPNAQVRLLISAKDDYGVAQVRLPYSTTGRPSGSVPVGTGEKTKKTLDLESMWELTSMRLKPGDTVRYRIEALDWDNLNGPHVGKTPELQLRVIDEAEARRRYEESRQEILQQLKDLIKEQKGAQADVNREKAAAQPKPEAVSAAEERQRSAATTAQDLARRVAELNRMAETNRLADQQESGSQRQAAQGLQQQATDKMPKAANKIGTAQTQAQSNPQGAKSDLNQASQQQEQIVQDLQKIQSQLQPANELKRLAERFEQLAQQQKALQAQSDKLLPQTLGKAMSELTPQEREKLQEAAQAQASLQKATAQAMADLQRASKNLQSSSPEQAQAAEQAAQDLQNGGVQQQQQGAQQSTQQNSLGQARSQQEQAAQQLQQAAQQLKDAQQQGGNLQQQLQQAANRLNKMMQKQSELQQRSQQSMSQQERQQAAEEQRQLEQQARALARQLEKLERRSPNSGEAAKELNKAGDQQQQASDQLQQGQQQQAQSKQQQAMQSMQRAMQSIQQAQQQAKKEEDPFGELRKNLTRLAARQKAIRDATRRIDEEQKAKGPSPEDQQSLQKLAQQQQGLESDVRKLENDLPGDVFKQFSGQARQQMTKAQQALGQGNPKDNPTGRAQGRAQTTLEQLAKALGDEDDPTKKEEGGGGGGGGGGGKPDMELLKRMAEVRLLRAQQQALRMRTEQIENGRREGEPLTEEQRADIDEAAKQQAEAKSQADRIVQGLQRYKQLQGKVAKATPYMKNAKEGLEKQNTGDAVQEQISQSIIRLGEALTKMQQQAKQQQQQQQQQANGQQKQQGQQPGQQQPSAGQQQANGQAPAIRSIQRRSGMSGGAEAGFDQDARGFSGLDPRAQDALRQSYKEKKPAEYEDLINRYYKALSERGR